MGTTEPDRERSMSTTPPEPTPTDPTLTAPPTPDADTAPKDWQAEADKWKALSRKHEDSAKSNADKAKRLDELETANATEIEKAQKSAEQARADAAAARAELAIAQAAVKHGLTSDDLELLGNHGTAEEIDARAEKLAARLKAAAPEPKKPDFGAGDRGDDITGGADTLDGQIAEAQKAGNLQLTIALKQKRSAQLLEKKS